MGISFARQARKPLMGMTETDFSEEGYFYQIGIPPMRVDILIGIPKRAFEQAWQNRNEVDFKTLSTPRRKNRPK